MRISNKNVWPILDNQKVIEEAPLQKLQRLVSESENIRKFNLK
jgi:hypothetical protein